MKRGAWSKKTFDQTLHSSLIRVPDGTEESEKFPYFKDPGLRPGL